MDDDPTPDPGGPSTLRQALVGTAKAGLVAVTLLFLSSLGGAMLYGFPVLVPLHWLAARRSGRWGTAGWASLAAASVFQASWMIVYVLIDDEAIGMFVGLLAALGVAGAFVSRRRNRPTAASPAGGR